MKRVILDGRMAVMFDGSESEEPLERKELDLKKVKVSKNGKGKTTVSVLFEGLFYNAETGERSPVTHSIDVQAPLHDDFERVLRRLAAHLAFRNDYCKKGKSFTDAIETGNLVDDLCRFKVGSVVFSGNQDDEHRGVQLFGNRELTIGGVSNFGTPLIKLEESKTNYEFNIALDRCLEDLTEEVRLFLGGKQKAAAQLELELEDGKAA